jgi:RNA-binding protein
MVLLLDYGAMNLSESQKNFLRGLGHQLKPVVTVGDAGLSNSVMQEFDSTISHHELIKVRVRAGSRESRDTLIDELCSKGAGNLVQRIGNVALIYRSDPDKPRIKLP